jgi:hypothetical protein
MARLSEPTMTIATREQLEQVRMAGSHRLTDSLFKQELVVNLRKRVTATKRQANRSFVPPEVSSMMFFCPGSSPSEDRSAMRRRSAPPFHDCALIKDRTEAVAQPLN